MRRKLEQIQAKLSVLYGVRLAQLGSASSEPAEHATQKKQNTRISLFFKPFLTLALLGFKSPVAVLVVRAGLQLG